MSLRKVELYALDHKCSPETNVYEAGAICHIPKTWISLNYTQLWIKDSLRPNARMTIPPLNLQSREIPQPYQVIYGN